MECIYSLKKEKITFAQRSVLLLSVLTMLIFINAMIWLAILWRLKSMGLQAKLIVTIMLFLFALGLGLALRNWIIRPYLDYAGLFKKFNNGQIYREFMDRAGFVFPGMEEVLLRYDKILVSQRNTRKTKRQSEFLALQNQINPHFLYNTLEAIRGDALSLGMESVANITEALATFFRYTITDTGSLVTIEDELDNVDNYFKIQKYRFGEKLDIIYEFVENDPDICTLLLPKLTLQPIIENAIYHGLERKSEGGEIRIGIELTERNVIIRIKDNGVGIDDQTLTEINYGLEHTTMPSFSEDNKNKRGGIALNNVCRRIKLLFGEDYGIHVYSLTGVGTEVCIILPVVKKESGFTYEGRIHYH
ncbi:MAG: sensor histidine kinase [Paenibacillaceae bacterium]|jgi:two-component system sensor histidine kinase YesM|nr:sensor histidine kinase [Paenibacillaceae bacterium]